MTRTRPTSTEIEDMVLINQMMSEIYWKLTRYGAERNELDEYFLEDAVMTVNNKVLTGRPAIAEAYQARQNENVKPGMTFCMLVGNPRVTVTGDTAIADLIWTGILNEDLATPPRLIQQGTDYTELVKVDGVWMISNRVITSLSNMPDAWNGS